MREAVHARVAVRAVAVALLVALIAVTVPVMPAHASHQYLWWNEDGASFRKFGSNASITIYMGAIEFACDRFQSAADVYVVPSGSASQGASLTDVSGSPNVVFGASGGHFIEETIGYAEPGGNIPSGRYAVVYDECQNGKVDPIDFVLDPAFEVDARADVPPLPSIAALKASAGEQAKLAETAAKRLAALFVAYNAYTLASDFMTGGSRAVLLMNMYMTWGCGVMFPSENPVEWYCPTVAPWDVMRLQADVVKLQVDQGRHWLGIANDPPDPNFRDPAPLGAVRTTPARSDDATEQALAALGQRWAVDAAAAGALLGSLEKYQGADEAGNGDAALLHARNIKANALLLADNFDAANPAIEGFVAAVQASGRDPEELLGLLEPERTRALSEGLNVEQRQVLANLGLGEADAAAFVEQMRGLDITAFRDRGGMSAFFDEVKSANAQSAADLRDLAGRMDPVIGWLDTQVRPVTPVASAGGPYSGTEGSPVALDASASTDPRGAALTFAWDVDGDGEFDDATGVTPTVTFDQAASRVVGVKVTNSDGRWGVAYAPVSIAEANRPPVISATTPPADTQRDLVIGDAQAFDVTASDPDGDVASFAWLLNGTEVDSGPAFPFAATADRAGLNTLQVRASDGHPLGGTATRNWVVYVHHSDSDGDGWRANTDCDDTDPDVYPGRKEVVGNGKDDDCDAATGDDGTPPAVSFTFAPKPAAAGRPVTFDATASDADGGITAYTWDFGDGATSDEADPTHTFASAGTYTVTLTVTDEQGDATTVSHDVVVQHPPVAGFSFSPALPAPGETVAFTDTSTDADGTVAGYAWDFGDGTASSDANPSHAYATAGRYEVELTVTDDAGATDTTTKTVKVASAGTAAFTVAKGRNTAQLEDGATVLHATSVYSASNSYRPENAIDGNASSAWVSASGQKTNQALTVRLTGSGVVDRVRLGGDGGGNGLRNFELRLSEVSADDADLVTVVTGTVPRDASIHDFTFPPTRARFARLLVQDNHGGSAVSVRTFALPTRSRQGGVVSLLEGVPATVVAASSAQATMPARNVIDGTSALWRSATGQPSNQSVTVALGGDGSHELDRVTLTNVTGTDAAREFEVRVSSTTADDAAFATVFTGSAARSSAPQRFTFSPVEARYVQLLVRNNHGHASFVTLNEMALAGPDGVNVARGAGVGAGVVAVSSQSGSSGPDQAIDFSNSGTWSTVTGATADQSFVLRLLDGGPWVIDRVDLGASTGTTLVRTFEIQVSTTTHDPASFTTVHRGVLPRDGRAHAFTFAPVTARYVRLLAVDNHGASSTSLNYLRVWSPQLGEEEVAFDDLSTDADGRIAAWAWEFGDGATSSEQHPVHTYAAPGTYPVRLTVTDEDGLTSSATMDYSVLRRPAPSFATAPVTPPEGTSTRFTSTSADPDGLPLAWHYTGLVNRTFSTADFSFTFPDNGDYPVTLTVTDSQLLTGVATQTVSVTNVAPTANAGTDRSLLWRDRWKPDATVNDAGATDRASLVCVWDFGDATPAVRITGCNSSNVDVAHAYARPGTYTATLTVTDKDGASSSDTLVATVAKRPTFLHVTEARSGAGGSVDVAVRLYDGALDRALGGFPVVATHGTQPAPLVTDADGRATTQFTLEPGVEEVAVSYAGDDLYLSTSTAKPIDAPLGDIVFFIDESGSMGDDIDAVKRNVTAIVRQLSARLNFRLGLVGFGAGGGTVHSGRAAQGAGHIHTPFTADLDRMRGALDELVVSGGYEPGYNATVVAMSDAMGFRPQAGACGVFVGDEPPMWDKTIAPETKDDALAALRARDAVFFSISSMDPASRAGYGPDPGSLAAETGGASFNIRDFARDPQPVLDALITKCIARIVAPELGVAITADAAEVRPGHTLTYTLAIDNDSAGPATGINLTQTLPAHTTLVSASDGATASGGVVTWPLFELPARAATTRTVTVRVDDPLDESVTELVTAAEVADDGANGADRDRTDNRTEQRTPVLPPDNAPPELEPIAEQRLDEGDNRTAVVRATDPDGDALTITAEGLPAFAALTDGGDGTGTLRLTPGYDDAGVYTATVTVSDGEFSDSEQVRIRVDDVPAPTAQDQDVTTPEDRAVTITLTADGAPERFDVVSSPSSGTLSGNAPDLVYTPDPNFFGNDEFTFTARNAAGTSAPATVRITVTPVNDAPVLEPVDDVTLDEDTTAAVTLAGNDVDGDALVFAVDGLPAFATLTDHRDGTARIALAPGYDDAGRYPIEVSLTDGTDTVRDGATITVINVNRAPVATANGPYTIDEAAEITLSAAGSTDPDRDELTYAWDIDGDGEFDDATGVEPIVTFDDNGAYTVRVRVSDPEGAADIAAAGVEVRNIAPTATFTTGPDVDEGDAFTLSLDGADDASPVDDAARFTYAFDCGDGSGFSTFGPDHRATCPTRDNATRAVAGRVRDKDGGVSEYAGEVVVRNVAPAISTLTAREGLAGALAFDGGQAQASFTDPGLDDTHAAAFTLPEGERPVDPYTSGQTVTFAFPQAGCDLTVAVEVRDDDGGTDVASTTVGAGTGEFLPPLREDGTAHSTKAGQVVPVKVRIADCEGNARDDLRPAIRVREGDGVTAGAAMTGAEQTPRTVAASQEQGVMRRSGNHYHYDLDADLAQGTWTILVYPFGDAVAGAPTLRHLLEVR